ncbi:hypothetical protein BO99DRAFT_403024 [Aspergillus violaceofuscus CBS 115571]|uniref:Uncharacterized protein n=1 Tax=Aspergillus violaceofuscus (strain CBS 115571) TaxID=1450538 RepID=A0A2V5I4H0_ASPV1|nr:hypothetical protein BO99DRAFT_403024 [Aspergillus violaceofuscus CBS 115571]
MRMATTAQHVHLDASHDQANLCSNASRGTPNRPATTYDATSNATTDPSRASPKLFGYLSTTSHPASHGAISHLQETAGEPLCDVTIQSQATSLEAINTFWENGCETSRQQAANLYAVSLEPMAVPQEPASKTPFNSLARSLEPSHNASKDDENTSCAYPITVAMAIDIVHQFSQELYEPPQHIYAEIVRSVQKDV